VPQILIKIQDSISALRSGMGNFRRDNEAQHERIEGLIRKQRRDPAAMMIIMRSTVSDFDERVSCAGKAAKLILVMSSHA
jgi:hypothetical protein